MPALLPRSRRTRAVLALAALAAPFAIAPSVAWPLAVLLATITLCIAIHEGSHAVTARLAGARVLVFALGFGPTLCGRDIKGTRVELKALLPVGGFVKLWGEAEDKGEGSFVRLSLARRIAVFVAGPASNLVLGFLLAMLATALVGVPLLQTPAAAAQLLGQVVQLTWNTFATLLPSVPENPMNVPVAGIAGMVVSTGSAMGQGPAMVAVSASLLSLSMGLLNLLPIPPFDGGGALLAVLRRVLGRRYPERAMRRLSLGTLVGVTGVMVLAFLIDGIRTLSGYQPPV